MWRLIVAIMFRPDEWGNEDTLLRRTYGPIMYHIERLERLRDAVQPNPVPKRGH